MNSSNYKISCARASRKNISAVNASSLSAVNAKIDMDFANWPHIKCNITSVWSHKNSWQPAATIQPESLCDFLWNIEFVYVGAKSACTVAHELRTAYNTIGKPGGISGVLGSFCK